MSQSDARARSDLQRGNEAVTPDEAEAAREKREPTVSEEGGFKNDPDDSTNPNEAIERSRRQVRP